MTTPDNWKQGTGERNPDHSYTKWYYNPEQELMIEQYWDEGGDGTHKIILYNDEKDEHGDRKNPYPQETHYEETEAEADKRATKVMRRHL